MYPGEQASAVLIVTVPASAGFAATERVSQALPCGERVAVKLALPEIVNVASYEAGARNVPPGPLHPTLRAARSAFRACTRPSTSAACSR
jgi:hypothetical protein